MIEETVDGFTRRLILSGAWDKRDRDPGKDYGIHGMELLCALIGPAGAVSLRIFTKMQLPHIYDRPIQPHEGWLYRPMGAGLIYHSPRPQYAEQVLSTRDCDILGRPCFSDGSYLRSDKFIPTFLAGGDEAVWTMLRDYYADVFESARAD